MLPFLIHIFRFAEVYTVLLAWIVIPLAFLASYQFCQSHYGLFLPPRETAGREGETDVAS